ALERGLAALEQGEVPVLGVVLNKLRGRRDGGYYYYSYYGSKSGRNGHHADQPEEQPVASNA
ncbi:MAG: hypothetical protein ACYC1C_21135, partial [Chloroflexota bacterium]